MAINPLAFSVLKPSHRKAVIEQAKGHKLGPKKPSRLGEQYKQYEGVINKAFIVVVRHTGVPRERIESKRKNKEISEARVLLSYLLVKVAHISNTLTGHILYGKRRPYPTGPHANITHLLNKPLAVLQQEKPQLLASTVQVFKEITKSKLPPVKRK